MSRYDAVVVGGGHNGLVCATALARAGRSVLVLEARDTLGGVAVGNEFHEGFRGLGPISSGCGLRPWVADELQLQRHGLERIPAATYVRGASAEVVLSSDTEATASSIADVSERDGRRYRDFCALVDGVRGVIGAFVDRPPLDLVRLEDESKLKVLTRALGIRRLGRDRMLELLRIAPMSAADLLAEYFESSVTMAGLALPAISQTYAGPRAPGTAANVLLHHVASSAGEYKGGSAAIIRALREAAERSGVEVRLGAEVTSIAVEGDRATAVAAGDERIEAGVVICACSPVTAMLELLPRATLSAVAEKHLRHVRTRGTIGHLSLAIDGEVALPGAATRMVIADDLDSIERAFDSVKYKTHAVVPVLDISVGTASDGVCPEGTSVLGVRVHYMPHTHEDGFSDEFIASAMAATMERLRRALPEVTDKVIASKLLTPLDLSERFRLPGGHLEHGEMALDQILVRPTPECIGYTTPVPGLLLASSGSHPGGGITGVPGLLAARAAIKRL